MRRLAGKNLLARHSNWEPLHKQKCKYYIFEMENAGPLKGALFHIGTAPA